MADYWNSVYVPANANNYSVANRPVSSPINKIVIHITQGSWSSATNWFQNPYAGATAHYTVRSWDGLVGRSVAEKDIAWHAGNWDYNQTSIGIEHEGYVANPAWYSEAMYDSSAQLTAYLCNKYGIPIDRQHIVGHNEVPGVNRACPGYYWYWSKYMDYVLRYAGIA